MAKNCQTGTELNWYNDWGPIYGTKKLHNLTTEGAAISKKSILADVFAFKS